MANPPPLRIKRNQLEAFLGDDFEAIRQFELLFQAVEAADPSASEALQIEIGNALAAANDATSRVEALKALLSDVEGLLVQPPAQEHNSLTTDYIDLPEDGPHVMRPRRIEWNADDGTVDIGLYGGSILQVGQEVMYRVHNNTGSDIPNGTVCGAVGVSPDGYARVAPYLATTTANAKFLLGVATVDIPAGGKGYVTCFGFVRDVNTSAWPVGTVLYASDTVAGAFTSTPPVAPTPAMIVALVSKRNATAGQLLVRPDFGSALETLHDVYAPSPSDGQVLTYVSSNSRWEAATPAAGGGTDSIVQALILG